MKNLPKNWAIRGSKKFANWITEQDTINEATICIVGDGYDKLYYNRTTDLNPKAWEYVRLSHHTSANYESISLEDFIAATTKQKPKFKVGDVVYVTKALARGEQWTRFDGTGNSWVKYMDAAVGQKMTIQSVYEDYNGGYQLKGGGGYWYPESVLQLASEYEANPNQNIHLTGLKKIYGVACSTWKNRITDEILSKKDPFSDQVSIPGSLVAEMFKASSDSQRGILIEAGLREPVKKSPYLELDTSINPDLRVADIRVGSNSYRLLIGNGVVEEEFAMKCIVPTGGCEEFEPEIIKDAKGKWEIVFKLTQK